MSASKEKATASSSNIKQAEFALKVVGASAVLTAIMGWPAVGLHFARYGIPSEIATTESAVRAGLLPALTLIVVFGYLWYVRWETIRVTKFRTESVALHTPLFLFHAFTLASVSMVAKYGGLFCAVFWIIGSVLIRLGLSFEPWNVLFVILVIVSLVITIGLIIGFRKIWKIDPTEEAPSSLMFLYIRFMVYFELLRNFLGLYFIHQALKFLKPNFTNPISLLGLLVIAAFLAMSGTLVSIGVAVTRGMRELGLGNLQASTGFAVIATFLAVMYYSIDVYPMLPNSLGGGRPNAVDVWLEDSKLTGFEDWPQVKVVEEQLHVQGAYLLHVDDKVLIMVDQPQPPGRWVVIPRSTVRLLGVGE